MYRKIKGQHSKQSVYDSVQAESSTNFFKKSEKKKNLKYLTSTE